LSNLGCNFKSAFRLPLNFSIYSCFRGSKPVDMRTGKTLICLIIFSLILYSCSDNTAPKSVFKNLGPEAEYVGMQSCLTCHSEVHKTYQHTGMGQSFAPAHQRNSDANFNVSQAIYEPNSDFYYFPFVKDSLMYVREFRLDETGDTIHNRVEKISYIVGSGHHTNSHIVDFNGYIFQAPVTYYTQDGKWDMAPSFREEGNLRFGRLLDSECITCHNHFPEHASGSLNKFTQMPSGIECERCHGPGSLHVEAINKGILVNTDKETDYTIVTPSKLPRELSMDVCERCHLQGIAVLEPGKTFYDFKPGMPLSEVANVFLPRFGDSDNQFIMASQADRLQQSKCYQQTDMTCLTCHHPHESVRQLQPTDLANMCLQCHQEPKDVLCSEKEEIRNGVNNQCHLCHMPKSGSLDIAHVSITDHKIQKYLQTKGSTQADKTFYGLELLTKTKATPIDMTRGYLALYDKYATIPHLMDSIKHYLDQTEPGPKVFNARIHYLFNKKDYKAIASSATTIDTSEITDAWTAYRIAQAYYYENNSINAIRFIEKAVKLQPLNLDFLDKEAVILMVLKRNKEAREKLEFILKENPKRAETLCNRGFLYVLQGNLPMGEYHYDKAISLNPDHEQALLNKAAVKMVYGKNEEAIALIQRVLKINPGNLQAQQALSRLRVN
jgi:predicted CXXCH cytochrome family protein